VLNELVFGTILANRNLAENNITDVKNKLANFVIRRTEKWKAYQYNKISEMARHENHSRKNNRCDTMENVMHALLVSSDTLITSKTSTKSAKSIHFDNVIAELLINFSKNK